MNAEGNLEEALPGGATESPEETAQVVAGQCVLHAKEVDRFQDLLREDPVYAYGRCGLSLIYSLSGQSLIDEMSRFGWQASQASDHFNLGALRSQAGDHAEALGYYTKAAELDSNHWPSYYNLALTYVALDDMRKGCEAARHCVRILEAKPELFSWEKESLEEAKAFLDKS